MGNSIKGVVLAGGTGSRLYPLTKVTNKHLLPVYDKPMIYYPLQTLKSMGCDEIIIVSGREHCGHILSLLGSGLELGLKLSYEIQEEAGGIAQALSLCKQFAGENNIAVCLGDNIFEKPIDLSDFNGGARIFLKEVEDPHRFGVAELSNDRDCSVISIEEKPKNPKSNYCVTGLYLYDNKVFDIISNLKPSNRGELEITDVNNKYIEMNEMSCQFLDGWWSDAGTFESLFKAGQLVRGL
jgi:glucose-1-phosphate thymidylyltransferase